MSRSKEVLKHYILYCHMNNIYNYYGTNKIEINYLFQCCDIVYKLYIVERISAQIIPLTNSIRKKRLDKNF